MSSGRRPASEGGPYKGKSNPRGRGKPARAGARGKKEGGLKPPLLGDGEFDVGGQVGGVVDALGGFFEVLGLGPENVGDEGLRVAVV